VLLNPDRIPMVDRLGAGRSPTGISTFRNGRAVIDCRGVY